MTVLDGKTIVDKKYITFPDDIYSQIEQEQANGVDLRLHRVFEVTGRGHLPATGKMSFDNIQSQEINPKNGWFSFQKDRHYAVDCRETINVPEHYCSILIPRSSLLRAGVYLTSALWDANFYGRTGGFLYAVNPIDIQYGARIGQMVFFKADYNGGAGYQGRYQGKDSQVGFFE